MKSLKMQKSLLLMHIYDNVGLTDSFVQWDTMRMLRVLWLQIQLLEIPLLEIQEFIYNATIVLYISPIISFIKQA